VRNYFGDIKTLLIVVLGVVIFLTRSCQGGSDTTEPQIITKVVTQWDTVNVEKTKYVPKIIEKVIINIDTFSIPIDTISVLKDYYAKYFYTDTIQIDTLGSIIVNDTITKNLISFRNVKSNIIIPTTTINNTIYIKKRELFGGVSVGGMINPVQDESPINYVSGELLYINKKRNVYGLGLGIDADFQPMISGRMYWKIGK
tara:strand:+ start:748 stop:1347 length:600 start_codon:yes stop_codon:yes gene_type:complete